MKRHILAYDSGCSFCAETAKNVEAAASGKLEASPLSSEEVLSYFKTSTGKHGGRPALLVVDKGRVRILEGWRLGVGMLSHLGIVGAYKVLRALGAGKPGVSASGALGRRGFLAASAGAVGAVGMLTAGPASAESGKASVSPIADWVSREDVVESEELDEDAARDIAEEYLASDAGQKIRDVGAIADLESMMVQGVRHKTRSSYFDAVSLHNEQVILAVYRKPRGNSPIMSATLLGAADVDFNGEPRVAQLLATSDGDVVDDSSGGAASEGGFTTYASCNQTACKRKGRCYSCSCTNYDAGCIAGYCGSCAWSCRMGVWSCVACAVIRCAATTYWGHTCCLSASCKYRASHTC